MKKTNYWSILMLLLTVLPMVVACGSDDDDELTGEELKQKVLGTWMCTESKDEGYGVSYDGLMVGKEVTILSNGTYTSTASTFGYTGTYTISGNTITAKNSSGGSFVLTVTVNGERMIWNGTANNGTKFKYVFVKESTSRLASSNQ